MLIHLPEFRPPIYFRGNLSGKDTSDLEQNGPRADCSTSDINAFALSLTKHHTAIGKTRLECVPECHIDGTTRAVSRMRNSACGGTTQMDHAGFRLWRQPAIGGCTVSTGHVAIRTIFSATLPNSSRENPR